MEALEGRVRDIADALRQLQLLDPRCDAQEFRRRLASDAAFRERLVDDLRQLDPGQQLGLQDVVGELLSALEVCDPAEQLCPAYDGGVARAPAEQPCPAHCEGAAPFGAERLVHMFWCAASKLGLHAAEFSAPEGLRDDLCAVLAAQAALEVQSRRIRGLPAFAGQCGTKPFEFSDAESEVCERWATSELARAAYEVRGQLPEPSSYPDPAHQSQLQAAFQKLLREIQQDPTVPVNCVMGEPASPEPEAEEDVVYLFWQAVDALDLSVPEFPAPEALRDDLHTVLSTYPCGMDWSEAEAMAGLADAVFQFQSKDDYCQGYLSEESLSDAALEAEEAEEEEDEREGQLAMVIDKFVDYYENSDTGRAAFARRLYGDPTAPAPPSPAEAGAVGAARPCATSFHTEDRLEWAITAGELTLAEADEDLEAAIVSREAPGPAVERLSAVASELSILMEVTGREHDAWDPEDLNYDCYQSACAISEWAAQFEELAMLPPLLDGNIDNLDQAAAALEDWAREMVAGLTPEQARAREELQTLAAIRAEQADCRPIIDPVAFEQLVREVAQEYMAGAEFEPAALEALQCAAEAHAIEALRAGNIVAVRGGACPQERVDPRHLAAARQLA